MQLLILARGVVDAMCMCKLTKFSGGGEGFLKESMDLRRSSREVQVGGVPDEVSLSEREGVLEKYKESFRVV